MRQNHYTHKKDWVVRLFVSAPDTPTDDCTEGNFAYDNNYFYVCISDDEWERTALASWTPTALYLKIDATHYLLIDGTHKLRIQ